MPRAYRHTHDEMAEHFHREGPPIELILATCAAIFLIVGVLTIVTQHNCAVFHVCFTYHDAGRFHPWGP